MYEAITLTNWHHYWIITIAEVIRQDDEKIQSRYEIIVAV